jgi:hypothetical protein
LNSTRTVHFDEGVFAVLGVFDVFAGLLVDLDPEATASVALGDLTGVVVSVFFVFDLSEPFRRGLRGVASTTTQLIDRETLSGGAISFPPQVDMT